MPTTALLAENDLVGHETGELVPCFGVEFHPVGHAPFGEIVRVNVYAHHPDPIGFQALAASFSGGQPLMVGPMEFLAVLKHPQEPVKVLGPVPGHTDNASRHMQPPKTA